MANSTRIGIWFGIPIQVHITLWLCLPLFALQFANLLDGVSFGAGLVAAAGLFVSVALHELGHALVSRRYGCRVREILLLPIGGVAKLERLPREPRAEILIALAGPAVSLTLFVFGRVAASLFAFWSVVSSVFMALAFINLFLALFNLLPSFPMDGGRIFRAWMTPRLGRLNATYLAMRVGRFLAVIMGLIGLFRGQIFLVAIAIFIYIAAGAEFRQVAQQEGGRPAPFFFGPRHEAGPRTLDPTEVEVSPPPYAEPDDPPLDRFWRRVQRGGKGMFDELWRQWH
ncbi:MAG: site-2 protease family protein [Candidatus Marinimicrobia bacterium]|nr:site-2 protease family protein [Candidatus Neomarinimicrobiota bacterium]